MWCVCLCVLVLVCVCSQAAEEAGKPYEWRVSAAPGVDPSAAFTRLREVLDGCLDADPGARWPLSRVLDALTLLHRDVNTGAHCVVVHPVAVPAPLVYDVIAIIDAMDAAGIDPAVTMAVADDIGGRVTSTLDVVMAKAVPALQVIDMRRLLAVHGAMPFGPVTVG